MSATPPPLNFPRGWTAIQVNSHLHTLKILFYVLGGIELAASLLFLMAAAGGYAAESNSPNPNAQPVLLAAIMILLAVIYGALGALSIVAGRRLAARQQHTLCKIAAGAACLSGALGIALGVYAFIVLLRPEVQAEFSAPGSTVVA